MEKYIEKMTRKGLTLDQAWSVYRNCMIEGGRRCLDDYLEDSEDDDVDKVQSISCRQNCRGLLGKSDSKGIKHRLGNRL